MSTDTRYQISITYEKILPGDAEAGEPSERGFEIEDETVDADELQSYAQDYGIAAASESCPSGRTWFMSLDSRHDREYFEEGIEKRYTLHVHNVDDRPPTKEDMRSVAKLIGITDFDQSFEQDDDDSPTP